MSIRLPDVAAEWPSSSLGVTTTTPAASTFPPLRSRQELLTPHPTGQSSKGIIPTAPAKFGKLDPATLFQYGGLC